MNSQTTRTAGGGRTLGAVIFALGVGLLAVVFALAAIAFAEVPASLAEPARSGAQSIGQVLTSAASKTLFLFVMAYAGSLLASKGLELYHAARDESGK
jgi:hypothetical protein